MSHENQPLTEELLERLLSSTSPESYLASNQLYDSTLAEYLSRLLAGKRLKRSQVIRASGLGGTYCYQLFSGERTNPSRDNVLLLAFGLSCTLTETQRLLRYAGVAELWCKLRRDAIIIHCLSNGYSLFDCDAELYRLGEKTLTPED